MTLPGSLQASESWNVAYPSLSLQTSENYNVEYTLNSGSGGSGPTASASDYVFISGTGVTVGVNGDTALLFASGSGVSDTGGSGYVFESGTGVDTGGETGQSADAEGTVNESWNVVYPSLSQMLTEAWNVDYPSLSVQVTKDWEN